MSRTRFAEYRRFLALCACWTILRGGPASADMQAPESAPACPGCGSCVVYDLTCHTYGRTLADGREQFMACLPCDSAVEYMCDGPDSGEGYPDEGCGWSYVHGLNPRNPRSAANEESRPPWLPGKFDGNAAAGCRMFGEDRPG